MESIYEFRIGMPISKNTVWPEYPTPQRVEVGGEITYEPDRRTVEWLQLWGQ